MMEEDADAVDRVEPEAARSLSSAYMGGGDVPLA
jgi:hypothetical protein